MNQITQQHILSAIEEIDKEGIPANRQSSGYDLSHDGKFYPPKLVLSIANRFATGRELPAGSFSGGVSTNSVLEKLGFQVIQKTNPSLSLIADYKAKIASTNLLDETYKWQLLKQFKGRPNTAVLDFAKEYKEVNFSNLLYAMAGGVGNHICREKPEEFRELFIALFDETTSLNQRVTDFNQKSLQLYRSLGQTLGHHQDERTIATYLTFHNPTKYTFYKNSYYIQFCALMQTKSAPKNEKYGHYLELLQQFIEEYVANDSALIEQVKSLIPEYYDGTNHLLLAQDILFQMLDKSDDDVQEPDLIQFKDVIQLFPSNELEIYFNFLHEIQNRFQLQLNDERLTFSIREDRLNFTIGNRYAWNVYVSNPKGKFGVMSAEKLNPDAEPFSGGKALPWYNHFTIFNPSAADKRIIFQAMEEELKRTKKSNYRRYNNADFEEFAFGNQVKSTAHSMKNPKNIILYGPPGTGKTYRLKSAFFDQYTTKETSISSESNFDETVRELTWWQVIAIALIESGTSKVSELVENRWVSHKASISESKNVRATIWGTLQMHTIQESTTVAYAQRQAPLIFDKNKDKSWSILESEAKEQAPELYEILNAVNNFNPNPDKEIKRYVFTTFHQSFSYEDFIEGIKPMISEDESVGSLGYTIESGIFKDLCLRAANDPDNQYAIFIDEINRGNVSAIFGELITLIEIDKRKNGKNPMSATLPYSKKAFSVPSNVDIIGTMNTADRSVEALDTALRRRFSFVEMMPDPELLKDEKGQVLEVEGTNGNILLPLLLKTINERIEVLVDRDHTIGHAYFMQVRTLDDLKNTFHKNIIPLLQEYFYGNYEKMELVLGAAFFEKTKRSTVKFAAKNSEFSFDGEAYRIRDISKMSTDDFSQAIVGLLNGEVES